MRCHSHCLIATVRALLRLVVKLKDLQLGVLLHYLLGLYNMGWHSLSLGRTLTFAIAMVVFAALVASGATI